MCIVLVWVFLHAEKLLYIPIYRECGSLHFLVNRQENICGNLEIKYYCILAYLTKMSWEKISVQGSTCVGKRLLDLASYEGGLPSNWGLPWRKLSTFDSHAPNPNKP